MENVKSIFEADDLTIANFEGSYEKAQEPLEPPVQENIQASNGYGYAYENGKVVYHDVYGVTHDFQLYLHQQLVRDAIVSQQEDKKVSGEVRGEEDLTAGRRKKINAVLAKAPELEKRVLSLIHIRDAVRDVFDAQTNACSNEELSALQDTLNKVYDQHVKNYGHIYRDTELLSTFRQDPTCPLMEVLENVDEETGVFLGKADIFTARTVMPTFFPEKAETAMDALAFSMQEHEKAPTYYMLSLIALSNHYIWWLKQRLITSCFQNVTNLLPLNATPFPCYAVWLGRCGRLYRLDL